MKFDSIEERNNFVMEHRKLVYFRANALLGTTEDDDANQEGFIGLIKAAENYNPNRGIKFSTFATRYIDGFIRTYRNLHGSCTTIRPSKNEFRKADEPVYWKYSISGFTDELLETLRSHENPEEEALSRIELQNGMNSCGIDKRQKAIISLRAMGFTQKEIGEYLGHERSYIARLENEAKQKLRAMLEHV